MKTSNTRWNILFDSMADLVYHVSSFSISFVHFSAYRMKDFYRSSGRNWGIGIFSHYIRSVMGVTCWKSGVSWFSRIVVSANFDQFKNISYCLSVLTKAYVFFNSLRCSLIFSASHFKKIFLLHRLHVFFPIRVFCLSPPSVVLNILL